MKKLISFILSIAMVLGCFWGVFAANTASSINVSSGTINAAKPFSDDAEDYVATILRDLGALEGDDSGNANPDSYLTRAEAATMLVRAMGLGTEGAIKTETKFSDVEKNKWYSGYIAVAYKNGFVDGMNATLFNPSSNLSANEAITMVLKVLGYDAKYIGGKWPSNYLAKATDLNILSGVRTGNVKVTRAEFFNLIYNCLEKELVNWKEGVSWSSNTGVLLYQKIKGKTSKSPVLNTPGGLYQTSDSYEVITAKTVFGNGFDASGYIGLPVNILYKVQDGLWHRIGIVSSSGVILTGSFDGNNFKTEDGKTYSFENGSVKLDAKAVKLVNGGSESLKELSKKAGVKYSLGVELNLYGQISKVYSQSEEALTSLVMVTKDEANALMYGSYQRILNGTAQGSLRGFNFKTTCSAYSSVERIDESYITVTGAAEKLSKIKENDILEIYVENDISASSKARTSNSYVKKIVVTRNTVQGIVEAKNDSVKSISISGSAYTLCKEPCLKDVGCEFSDIEVNGFEYKLFLDSSGNVAYTTLPGLSTVGDASLAFVKAAGTYKPGVSTSIDAQDGKEKEYISLIIVGENSAKTYYPDMSFVDASLKSGSAFNTKKISSGSIVEVKFNGLGEIASLKLKTGLDEKGLYVGAKELEAAGVLGRSYSYSYASNLKVIELQSSLSSKDTGYYKPISLAAVLGCNVTGSFIRNNSGKVEYVIYKSNTKRVIREIDSKIDLAIFESKFTQLGANNEVKYFGRFTNLASFGTTNYEITKELYDKLLDSSKIYTLMLDGTVVVDYTEYSSSTINTNSCVMGYVSGAGSAKVEYGYMKFDGKQYPYGERVFPFKYVSGKGFSFSNGDREEIAAASSVLVFDTNDDGFLEVIIMNYLE